MQVFLQILQCAFFQVDKTKISVTGEQLHLVNWYMTEGHPTQELSEKWWLPVALQTVDFINMIVLRSGIKVWQKSTNAKARGTGNHGLTQ